MNIFYIQSTIDEIRDNKLRKMFFIDFHESLEVHNQDDLVEWFSEKDVLADASFYISDKKNWNCNKAAVVLFEVLLHAQLDKDVGVKVGNVFDKFTQLEDVDSLKKWLTIVSFANLISELSIFRVSNDTTISKVLEDGVLIGDKTYQGIYYCALIKAVHDGKSIVNHKYGKNIIEYLDFRDSAVRQNVIEIASILRTIITEFFDWINGKMMDDEGLAITYLLVVGRLAEVTDSKDIDAFVSSLDYHCQNFTGFFLNTAMVSLRNKNLPHLNFNTNIVEFLSPIREKIKLEGKVAEGKKAKDNGRI